jgi:hypothetical protein
MERDEDNLLYFFKQHGFSIENHITFAPSKRQRGALIFRAEIIPTEPDAGNAAEGRQSGASVSDK